MLTGETTMEIRILRRQGLSIRAISRDLGLSRETVRKYLRSPDLEPRYGPRAPRASKVEPFKDYLRMRLKEANQLGLYSCVERKLEPSSPRSHAQAWPPLAGLLRPIGLDERRP